MRRRLTYANTVSSLALLLALAGGTAWAAGKIGPTDIKRDAVRTKHIGVDQVRSAEVAGNALTGDDVADNSLRTADIDESSLRFECVAAAAFFQVADICYSARSASTETLANAEEFCEGFGMLLPSVSEAQLIIADQGSALRETTIWTGDYTSQSAAMVVRQNAAGVISNLEFAKTVEAFFVCVAGPVAASPLGSG